MTSDPISSLQQRARLMTVVALATAVAGCVRVTEIVVEVDPVANATIDDVRSEVTGILQSMAPELVDARGVRWRTLDERTIYATECQIVPRKRCVVAGIDKASLRSRFSITVENPRGCFNVADHQWAKHVAATISGSVGSRGRETRDVGVCNSEAVSQ